MNAIPQKSQHKDETGFSLIEVLVALVNLGVGLMGLARLQLYLLAGSADTVAMDHAVRLANEQLETLRFMRWTGGTPTGGADEIRKQGLAFRRDWQVVCTSAQPASPCRAQVVLHWREPRGDASSPERQLVVEGYLAGNSAVAEAWLVQYGAPGREPLP